MERGKNDQTKVLGGPKLKKKVEGREALIA